LSNKLITIEPQGYWFGTGPSVFVDYYINQYFILHGHMAYSAGFWRAEELDDNPEYVDDSYPNPHFGSINLIIQSKWGFMTGIDYNWLINRGENPNNTRRFDLIVGFRFPI